MRSRQSHSERWRPHGRDQGYSNEACVVLREEGNGNNDNNDEEAVIAATVLRMEHGSEQMSPHVGSLVPKTTRTS